MPNNFSSGLEVNFLAKIYLSLKSFFQDLAYIRKVNYLAYSKSAEIGDNYSLTHAVPVMESLAKFGLTQKTDLNIVSGNAFAGCYSNLVRFVDDYSSAGLHINLVLTDPEFCSLKENTFVKKLMESAGHKIFVLNGNRALEPRHFAVTSASAFRLETDHSKAKAIFCFNSSDLGQGLNNLFRSYVQDSEELTIENLKNIRK